MNNVPTPTACVGICNSSWRRAEAARLADHTPHELTPRAGEPVWCEPCARHLRYALAALPDLAARLLLEVKNATTAGTEHVSGSKERPIHAREKYTFCLDDIDDVLDSWAAIIREDRNLATARPARQGRRVTVWARLLLVQFDWVVTEHPGAEEFGLEIQRVHRHATRLTHTDDVRAERCDGVPCPRCDYMAMEREIDWQGRATGYIACRSCGSLLSEEEYGRWLKMVAAPLRKSVVA